MIILSKPAASPYLARSLFALQEPVILADSTVVPMQSALNVWPLETLRKDPQLAYRSLILTASENGLSCLYEAIPNDDRVLKAKLFKDKAVFRKALRGMYPGFFFQELSWNELKDLDLSHIPFPVMLKPAVGISSIGVFRVRDAGQWQTAVQFIEADLKKYQANYSGSVVDGTQFLVESWIEGAELAIDAYYDSNAEPVILNILEHLFAHEDDTSDLVYYTQRSLMRRVYEPVMKFLKLLGDTFDLKRFPLHVEVRMTSKGDLVPIEVNPLRFSGLGTTEIAEYAYGINVYQAFFKQEKPNWTEILAPTQHEDSVYTFMCADLPSDYFRHERLKIDDRALFKEFKEVLDYRILPEEDASTFAVIFSRSDDLEENKKFLNLDFRKFLKKD